MKVATVPSEPKNTLIFMSSKSRFNHFPGTKKQVRTPYNVKACMCVLNQS